MHEDTGEWPSVSELAKRLNMSRHTLTRHLDEYELTNCVVKRDKEKEEVSIDKNRFRCPEADEGIRLLTQYVIEAGEALQDLRRKRAETEQTAR